MLYSIIKSIFKLVFVFFCRWELEGLENIPKDGPLIICSNHIHWLDPPLVGTMVPNKQVHFMAKQELFEIKVLGPIIKRVGAFPVKRDSADLKTIRTALRLLKGKKFVALFPEGTRSKDGQIGEALPGVGLIALKSRSPVLPVAIKGKYKLFGKIKVKIGQPITFDKHYDKRVKMDLLKEVSGDIMNQIKLLHKSI